MKNKEISMNEKEEFENLLETVQEKHPFESAELCKTYCYYNRPTYVTNPAHTAFTYPEYDSESLSFNYKKIDLDDNISDDISIELYELIDENEGDISTKQVQEIIELFNIPICDIENLVEDYFTKQYEVFYFGSNYMEDK